MKTKHTHLLVAGTAILLLNPFILNAQWSAVRYDQYNIFQHVSAPTASTVFVTGVDPNSQDFVLRTNDGGANWDSVLFNTINTTYVLSELYFFDVNTVF